MIRRIFFSVVLLFFVAPSFSQEDNGGGSSKDHAFTGQEEQKVDLEKGKLLPREGDWSISFGLPQFGNDITSGNLTLDSTGFSGRLDYTPLIMVRKFNSDNMAYRGGLQINYKRSTESQIVAKDTLGFNANNPEYVEDKMHTINRSITLRLGIEKRRGSSRVQGVYGAEVLVGYFNTKQKYEYGNEMNADFDRPNIHNFGNNSYDSYDRRLTVDKRGDRFVFGVRGFGGAEVFVLPKMSLGLNVGYTLGLSVKGQREQTKEYFDPGEGKVETVTIKQTPDDNVSSIGLTSYDLRLTTNFYF